MRLLACCLALCVVVGGPRGASAGPDQQAKALYDRGTALFALQKFGDAADAYEKAFVIKPVPAILYNAAQAHRLAGNKQRALTLYENCLHLYAAQLPQYLPDIKAHIDELRVGQPADGTLYGPPAPTPSVTAQAPPVGPIVAGTTVTEVAPEPERRPLRKKAWFWGAIGGSIVVVGAAVAVGVVLGTRSAPNPMVTFGKANGN